MKSPVTDPWSIDPLESAHNDLETSNSSSQCFEDSFVSERNVPLQVFDSRLPDSAEYLASLESKLEKLKSKRKGKDIVKSLEERNKTSMLNFLSNDNQTVLGDEDFILDTPINSNHPVMRYIAPDKQALTLGELVELLKADHLAQALKHESDDEKKVLESPN